MAHVRARLEGVGHIYCSLRNSVLSNTHLYSTEWLNIVNNEEERKWKEMAKIQLKVQVHHFCGGIKSVWFVMRVSVPANTQTSHLQNTCQKYYCQLDWFDVHQVTKSVI